jgi:hypothetical protein
MPTAQSTWVRGGGSGVSGSAKDVAVPLLSQSQLAGHDVFILYLLDLCNVSPQCCKLRIIVELDTRVYVDLQVVLSRSGAEASSEHTQRSKVEVKQHDGASTAQEQPYAQ